MTLREILAGQHTLDAGQLQRLGEVDAENLCMCVGAVNQLAVIGAGQVDVVGIDGGAGDLCHGVNADVGVALSRQLIVLGLFVDALNVSVVFLCHNCHD